MSWSQNSEAQSRSWGSRGRSLFRLVLPHLSSAAERGVASIIPLTLYSQSPSGQRWGTRGHVHWPNTLMWAWLRYKTQACRRTQMPEHKHAYLASSSLSRIFDKMHAHAQRNRNVPVWWYCYCQAVLVFPFLNGLTGRVNIKEGFLA